jgi:hypothetical protein
MQNDNPTKAGWRIIEWMADTGLSRSLTYNLLKAGRIKAVKLGAVLLITTPPHEFLMSLPAVDYRNPSLEPE